MLSGVASIAVTTQSADCLAGIQCYHYSINLRPSATCSPFYKREEKVEMERIKVLGLKHAHSLLSRNIVTRRSYVQMISDANQTRNEEEDLPGKDVIMSRLPPRTPSKVSLIKHHHCRNCSNGSCVYLSALLLHAPMSRKAEKVTGQPHLFST